MSNRIEVRPNEEGRIIIELYGEKIEIDESMFKDGVATLKKFGDVYEIVAVTERAKPEKKQSAKVAKESRRKVN